MQLGTNPLAGIMPGIVPREPGEAKMQLSPMLLLHISSGIFGVLSGAVALSFRKGSRRHGLAGMVFAISMTSLAATGVYLAVVRHTPGNIFGGTLTFYLVATAWMTLKRQNPQNSLFDWSALAVALAIGTVSVIFGIQAAMSPTGLKYDYDAGPYFFLASIALISAAGDVRMLLRGGISGTQRIARHLWRMCFALFIGSASIFLARQHLFPAFMRRSGMLVLLSLAPLLLMIFWLIRIRFANARRRIQLATTGPEPSLSPR